MDELLKLILKDCQTSKGGLAKLEPLNYPTQGACPLCQKKVEYYPVVFPDAPDQQVIIRVCGCTPTVSNLPVKGEEL